MAFSVTEAVLDNVLRRVSAGSDPLGIGTGMARTHSGDRAQEVVHAALAGLTDAQATKVENALRANTPGDSARMDLVTCDLLAEQGVDPLAVAWLASVDDGLSVYNEDLATVIEFDGTPFGAVTSIGWTTFWSTKCVLTVPGLPDTVVAAAKGRLLQQIVSQSVLDRHPLIVREADLPSPTGYSRLSCRREVWILDGLGHPPQLMSHMARIHDLVDGHLKVIAA